MSGMNCTWDKYTLGVNEMRIVGKDDAISYIYCCNVIIQNLLPSYRCNFCRV